MKTIFSAILLLLVLVSASIAPGLRADGRREFISETMHSDVQKLLDNCGREIIGAEPFSSKNNNVTDSMIGFYDTDHGLLVTLHTLKQRFDDYGRAVPDIFDSELVAVVFVDRLLLWYQSEAAKSTLKAQMARLTQKQSI